MKIEKIHLNDKDSLLPRLMGQVFHLTTREIFEKIQLKGAIFNNKSGELPIHTGSEKSYGRLLGNVCLFDLRTADLETVQKTLECYDFLSPPWFSKHGRKYITWDLAYLFLNAKFHNQLIPSSQVHEHYRSTGQYLQAVPKTEAWVKNNIPLTWIDNILFAKIKKLAPDRNTGVGRHYWAVLKANKTFNKSIKYTGDEDGFD